jgi:uncharacterized protein YPO0396
MQWVNHLNNQLHVRFLRDQRDVAIVSFLVGGYTQKLNFKPHPLILAAKKLLAGYDLHCVSSIEALKSTEYALTVQGMISRRQGKYEKHDQKRLDQDWMTGFDNNDQLDALTGQLQAIRKAVEQWQREVDAHQRALIQLDEQLKAIDSLLQLEYATIDLPRAEAS